MNSDTLHPNIRRNHILSLVDPAELNGLRDHLESVTLRRGQRLQSEGDPFKFAYFPVCGLLSLSVAFESGKEKEVGIAGWEGMVGIPLVLGTEVATTDVEVQIAGQAMRLAAPALRNAMRESPVFAGVLLRYVDVFYAQVGQAGACNAYHSAGERLARWLLMAQDRMEEDALPLTHEYLAMMLGAHRPVVTAELAILKRAGFIESQRGLIFIKDRAALEEVSCECYTVVNRRYRQILHWSGKQAGAVPGG